MNQLFDIALYMQNPIIVSRLYDSSNKILFLCRMKLLIFAHHGAVWMNFHSY